MATPHPRMAPLGRLFGAEVAQPVPCKQDSPPPARSRPPEMVATLSRKQRVRRAFQDIPLSPREHRALAALLRLKRASATELSEACGWMHAGWRTQMLLLCQRRRRHFWPGGMGSDITNGIILGVLTDYDPDTLKFRARKGLKKILRAAVAAAE